MKINFLDLNAQYLTIKDEVNAAIQKVLDTSAYVLGPSVKAFEEDFAKAHNAKYCVGVNNGTSALHIALWALGIQQGDEVIVPANTFFATPESVSLCGATPIFADCDAEYYNMDPASVEKAVTKKTKAIIAVHLYGQPADLDPIREIAEKHKLLLIEDCAQSHLAEYKGRSIGTHGICGCFSFYPGKNLGAYGEGGAVITNDEKLYKKMLVIRDHGSAEKYYHDIVGHNYRLEGIQGAVLGVKLKYLPKWTDARRKNAALYSSFLKDCKQVVCPKEMKGVKHVYHLYVVRVQKRDELAKFLKDNGIFTGIHYPIPCHLQKAYASLPNKKGDFPVSEKYAGEIISLPMFAELKENEIKYVCDKIMEFYK